MDKVEAAIEFFTKKFYVDNEEGSKEENLQDWKNCISYVGKYGLHYEVFVAAHEELDPDESFIQCSRAIGTQMDEWDL